MGISIFKAAGLSRKLLLIHLPLTVLAVLAVFAVLEVDYYFTEQDRLRENLARMVNTQGTAIESAVWEFDLQHLRDLLEKQTHLPFLQSVVVHGGSGELLGAVGDLNRPLLSPELRLERPLRHQSGTEVRIIGRMVVTAHDDGIRMALIEHLKVNGSILLALMATLVAGTLYGVGRVIGGPLEEFRDAIQRPMEEQMRAPLHWDRADELGDVLQAYNEMMKGRHLAEIAMKKREDDLRLAVRRAEAAGAEAARFNRLAIDRELRMMELKGIVNQLSMQTGRDPPFAEIATGAGSDAAPFSVPMEKGEPEGDESGTMPTEAVRAAASLETILDLPILQPLLDDFAVAVGGRVTIIDSDGDATGFVRALNEGEEYPLYRDRNGLTEAVVPIRVDGRHLGALCLGPFFRASSDRDRFQAAVEDAGSGEGSGLEGAKGVGVLDADRLPAILGFLTRFARLMVEVGTERITAWQSRTDLHEGRLAALNLAEDAEKARRELAEYQKHLESLVEERTTELRKDVARRRLAEAQVREKMEELEKFTAVAVGRELRMIALKEEVNALNVALGRDAPYRIVE
ncbi:MAG: PocR ligand-binding domain-containing protein [Magnetococcales bacterium]|nr:PocR ligand-binding domain-containing protein [Magnetococcales bacterium]